MFNFKQFTNDLPANCLFEKILTHVDGCTDAADEFILVSSLAAMATTVGSNVWIPFGTSSLYPNLYIIKIGASSQIRKTTSDRIVIQFLNEVCKDRVFPNDITPERLIDKMSGTSTCLLRFTEIGGAFKKMESTRYLSGYKALITEFYDNDTYQKELKGNRKGGESTQVEIPCVSILGSSTLEWFQLGITMDDIASGLLPRFQFSYVKQRTKPKLIFPKKADPVFKESIVEDFKLLAEKWTGEKTVNTEAQQAFTKWCTDMDAEYDNDPTLEKVGSFFDRLEKAVLKIALLMEGMLQVTRKDKFENVDSISLPAMNLAIQLGIYFRECVKELVLKELKLNPFESDIRRIVKCLRKRRGECTQRVLSQDTGIYGADLRDVLDAMEDLGMVKRESIETKGGMSFKVTLLSEDPVENAAAKGEVEVENVPSSKETSNREDVIRLCDLLFDSIRSHFPTYKANLETRDQVLESFTSPNWYEQMRKLIELDERTVEQIGLIISFVHGNQEASIERDPFWSTNILSPLKLRKHFDQLVLNCREKATPKSNMGYL